MQNNLEPEITVFYDSECPYCKAQIKWYRFLDRKQKKVCWVDITKDHSAMNEHAVTYDTAMAELQVTTTNGEKHQGVKGFYAIWSILPLYRIISP